MITLEEDLKTATNEIKMVVQEQKTLYRNKLQQQYEHIKDLESALGTLRVINLILRVRRRKKSILFRYSNKDAGNHQVSWIYPEGFVKSCKATELDGF